MSVIGVADQMRAAARAVVRRVLDARTPVICVTLATCVASAVRAADKPFAAPQAAEHVPASSAGSLAQVTLSLLLVLAAVFAAAWVVRRLRSFGRPGAGAIELIADLPLGAKERAVLVQVGAQQLLLGVTTNGVTTLHVLSEPIVNGGARTPDRARPESPQSPDFRAILRRSLGLK